MKVDQFDFDLPPERIALRPVYPRDASRMLVVRGGEYQDAHITDILRHLHPGDVMVFNDTRVIPARLIGKRGEAMVEILLHKPYVTPPDGGVRIPQHMRDVKQIWQCFAKPAKRLREGDTITFAPGFTAQVTRKLESGEVILTFDGNAAQFHAMLERHGSIPLPPYIEKQRKADEEDNSDYQTVFSDTAKAHSVAAPTAGLHFTDALLAAIDAQEVQRVHVTLHVGAGTFLPVKAEDTAAHIMHSERAEITKEAAERINRARANGGRIIAVGTTSLRTLESAADANGRMHPFNAETNIFITPGYRFKAVDMLLTNFHLPRSTLFMLVSAFCGLEVMQRAYAHAISNFYRFYSYGDACLLYRNEEPS